MEWCSSISRKWRVGSRRPDVTGLADLPPHQECVIAEVGADRERLHTRLHRSLDQLGRLELPGSGCVHLLGDVGAHILVATSCALALEVVDPFQPAPCRPKHRAQSVCDDRRVQALAMLRKLLKRSLGFWRGTGLAAWGPRRATRQRRHSPVWDARRPTSAVPAVPARAQVGDVELQRVLDIDERADAVVSNSTRGREAALVESAGDRARAAEQPRWQRLVSPADFAGQPSPQHPRRRRCPGHRLTCGLFALAGSSRTPLRRPPADRPRRFRQGPRPFRCAAASPCRRRARMPDRAKAGPINDGPTLIAKIATARPLESPRSMK